MSEPFKIEKGVPFVDSHKTYPFAEMDVGDSFLVPHNTAPKAQPAASAYGYKHGKKFATRNTADGLRIWRIA